MLGNWIHTKNDLDLNLTPFTKINSIYHRLKSGYKTIKLLKINIAENIWDLELGKKILDLTPNHSLQKKKKLYFFKTTNFCSAEDIVKRMKRGAIDGKKIISKHIAIKRLIPSM